MWRPDAAVHDDDDNDDDNDDDDDDDNRKRQTRTFTVYAFYGNAHATARNKKLYCGDFDKAVGYTFLIYCLDTIDLQL